MSLFQIARDLIAGLLITAASFVGAGQWEDDTEDEL